MTRMPLFIVLFLLSAVCIESLYAGPDIPPPPMEEPEAYGLPGEALTPPPAEVIEAIGAILQAQEPPAGTQPEKPVSSAETAEKTVQKAETAATEPAPDSEQQIESESASAEPPAAQTEDLRPNSENGKELTGYDRYRIISQQNIFSRLRTPARPRSSRNDEKPAEEVKPVVIALYMLRGIAEQGSRKIAFVEDAISGQTLRAEIGSEVLNGTIRQIFIDRVVFEENGQVRDIKIGDAFGKRESGRRDSGQTAPTAAPAAPAAPRAPAGSQSQEELLRQMIERRNRELNR
ncbi:MAG: hypothetical protein KBI46_11550 [Phycisphaerae bacterium]|nr:hypothetical protein [Phycisphaerae bacterium]